MDSVTRKVIKLSFRFVAPYARERLIHENATYYSANMIHLARFVEATSFYVDCLIALYCCFIFLIYCHTTKVRLGPEAFRPRPSDYDHDREYEREIRRT
jgi:hypothetical protein